MAGPGLVDRDRTLSGLDVGKVQSPGSPIGGGSQEADSEVQVVADLQPAREKRVHAAAHAVGDL
jgi:hypothetical protein